jgi:hypothetical protein
MFVRPSSAKSKNKPVLVGNPERPETQTCTAGHPGSGPACLEDHFRELFRGPVEQWCCVALQVFVKECERIRIDDIMCPLDPDRPAEANCREKPAIRT